MNFHDDTELEKQKRQLELEAIRAQELRDIETLMSCREGRRFFKRILAACGTFDSPYGADQLATGALIGRQGVGLLIYKDIMTACPSQYLEMVNEKRKEDKDE